MKEYLIEFFQFNESAMMRIIDAVQALPANAEAARLISHMIDASQKWFNRIKPEVKDSTLSWNGPAYPVGECTALWQSQTEQWVKYLRGCSERDLLKEVIYQSSDGGRFSSTITDIALQLNYHAIHHRAQIMMLIRQQGNAPPASDYILLKRKTLQL